MYQNHLVVKPLSEWHYVIGMFLLRLYLHGIWGWIIYTSHHSGPPVTNIVRAHPLEYCCWSWILSQTDLGLKFYPVSFQAGYVSPLSLYMPIFYKIEPCGLFFFNYWKYTPGVRLWNTMSETQQQRLVFIQVIIYKRNIDKIKSIKSHNSFDQLSTGVY